MKIPFKNNLIKSNRAFTLIELLVVIGTIGIMSAILIPNLLGPEYKLKKAARELMNDMQKTRAMAIKTNKEWAIVFVPDTDRVTPPINDKYFITSNKGTDDAWSTIDADGTQIVEKEVTFSNVANGVHYGHGGATKSAQAQYGGVSGLPSNNISYPSDVLSFNSKGRCSEKVTGYGYRYVYLEYRISPTVPAYKNMSYAVGTSSTGVVQILFWGEHGGNWQ